ncbi:MAG: site-specific integrase [Bacteroidales bacterium]|nr:site-specific integrase [Bacteroidales bacterium]
MGTNLRILYYLKYGSPPRDGKLPLMCRLTIDGRSTSFSCKRRLPPERWDARHGMLKGNDPETLRINRELEELKKQLLADYSAILREYGPILPTSLKNYTMGAPSRQEMLMYVFNRHNEDFQKMVGHGRSLRSLRRYETVYRHLRDFLLKRYQLTDVRFNHITLNPVTAFETYLRVEKGLKTNTVWVYMTTFKHILTLAQANGVMHTHPFSGYKGHFEQVDRGYLTEEELGKVMTYPAAEGTERLVRDLFVFAAFTGLSYSDVKALRWDNIRPMFDGNTWIVTRRQKTHTPSNVRLLDIPLKILKELGDPSRDTVFKIPSNNCCNEYLIALGKNAASGPE